MIAPIDTNPYEPPQDSTISMGQAYTRRSSWPVWIAAGWVLFLILLLPAIPVSRLRPPPDGAFLPMQLVTTTLSIFAAGTLLFWPRQRRWLLINVPVVALLAAVQWMAWSRFP